MAVTSCGAIGYPTARRTIRGIGVTTGKSPIMKVFPAWSDQLGLKTLMSGINFAPNRDFSAYREAVEFTKTDFLSPDALVTKPKMDLHKSSRDLIEKPDPYAQTSGEISKISKRPRLVGTAKEPISAGARYGANLPAGYRVQGGPPCIPRSGGPSLALTLDMHKKARSGGDIP